MFVEHIVARVVGGDSEADNLCVFWYHCNEFKGPRQQAADPCDGQFAGLSRPRQQKRWGNYFACPMKGVTIRGLSPAGPATIALLQLNSDCLM